MAQVRNKKAAASALPLGDAELGARVRAAAAERALSKAELPKRLGALNKVDTARALDIARELARKGELHRFAKGTSETFYREDPVSTLDRAVPELLRRQGPLGATALKREVKAALPGHDGFFGEWLKPALARGVIYEGGTPKVLSPDPPIPDLEKLLGTKIVALAKQMAAVEARGIARDLISDFVRSKLALDPRQPDAPAAPTTPSSSREVFLEALRRFAADSPKGALLPVRELRARAGLAKKDFDAAALALSKEGLLVLHHHDHASALSQAEQDALVRDAVGRHYIGVALRRSP
jgi:hypothetical protein